MNDHTQTITLDTLWQVDYNVATFGLCEAHSWAVSTTFFLKKALKIGY